MAVCSPFDPDDLKNENKYTNVEYSEDGSSLTIYMNGSAPVPANRALSNKLAQLGHDFFEVTFLYNDANTYRIARASWELGEPAGVNDVYRTDGVGNIYYNISTPLGNTTTGIPATNEGLVVLFVGRKSDKTLLAVGTLSEINGTAVSASNNRISTTTTKVKFHVNALKAGVSSESYADSSFQTAPVQTDPVKFLTIGTLPFPHFNVPVSHTTPATYTFDFHTDSLPTSPPTAVNFSFYAPAIRYGAGAAECWNIRPQYTLPPNIVQNNSEFPHSSAAGITTTGLPSAGDKFTGQIGFNITTASTDKVICALAFQIPVYAVYKRAPPVSGETEPVQWYIRPGYNMYYRELDNGKSENGGAVLISIGAITGDTGLGIVMDGEPLKYMTDGDAPNTYGRSNFTLTGMEFFFKDSPNRTTSIITANMTPGNGGNYPNAYGWGSTIKFYYDKSLNNNGAADEPFTSATVLPYGLVKFRLEYVHSTGTYSYIFFVEVNNISSVINIAYQDRFFILKKEDYTDAWNRMQSNGNYLLVFAENINLPDFQANVAADVNVFMVATVPNITIGRQSGTDQTKFAIGNHTVNIYLGKWPFNEPAFAGGDVIVNELFRVSSRGTWENYGGGGTLAGTRMFAIATGSGALNVTVLAGIEVSYPNYIK